jgi:bifunctional UDP-N-acetylglucosamine pyrophosphorylase/glucosamine-1-phosphate N-acetyltransferase
VNLGAGTIVSNLRHDGKNHRSKLGGLLVDTGRRKFGTIIGDHVHTGIQTSIYPGRKLWPHTSTLPAEVVRDDVMGGA